MYICGVGHIYFLILGFCSQKLDVRVITGRNTSEMFESFSFFCFLMQLSSFIYYGSDLDLDLCVSLKLWLIRFHQFIIFYSFWSFENRTSWSSSSNSLLFWVEFFTVRKFVVFAVLVHFWFSILDCFMNGTSLICGDWFGWLLRLNFLKRRFVSLMGIWSDHN